MHIINNVTQTSPRRVTNSVSSLSFHSSPFKNYFEKIGVKWRVGYPLKRNYLCNEDRKLYCNLSEWKSEVYFYFQATLVRYN